MLNETIILLRRAATLDRNPRSRGGSLGPNSHALGGGGGGSTSNLVIGPSWTSSAHLNLNLQQPHKSRSERDLTKVTKVRLRLSRDETASPTASKQPQSSGRTKMKTTTMIGGAADNDGPAVSEVPFVPETSSQGLRGERVDVVRAPLNRHLG